MLDGREKDWFTSQMQLSVILEAKTSNRLTQQGIYNEEKLTNVTRQTPALISHILIDLSLDPETKNGPGLPPFFPP